MRMRLLLVIVIIFFVDLASAMKVRERLLKHKKGNPRCIIFMYKEITAEEFPHDTVYSVIESANYVVRDLNCTTLVERRGFYSKIPGPNETYDGYVEVIQSNEADFGTFFIRPDLLPGEPGKISPPIVGGDIIIISAKYPPEMLQYDLTKFLDLPSIIYIYFVLGMFFMIPLIYAYTETKRQHSHPNAIQVARKYMKCCEDVVNLLLDQEQFLPSTVPGQLIALAASLFALFAIRGVILNMVGADLVVISEKSPVDSIDDLLSSDIMPMVLKNQFEHYLMQASPEGSKQHQLWLKIKDEMPHSVPFIQQESTSSTLHSMISQIWSHKAAMVQIEFIGSLLTYLSCVLDFSATYGRSAVKMYASKEKVSRGMMTGLMSHQIHPYTENVLRNALTTSFETGLFEGMTTRMRYVIPLIYPEANVKINSTTLGCIEGEKKEEEIPSALDIKMLKHSLLAWLCLWFLSALSLVVEMCFKWRENKKRIQRIDTVDRDRKTCSVRQPVAAVDHSP